MRVTGTVDGPGSTSPTPSPSVSPGVSAIGLVLSPGAVPVDRARPPRATVVGAAGTVLTGDARDRAGAGGGRPRPLAGHPAAHRDGAARGVRDRLRDGVDLRRSTPTSAAASWPCCGRSARRRGRSAGCCSARRWWSGWSPRRSARCSAWSRRRWFGDLLVRAGWSRPGSRPRASLLAVGSAVLTGIVVAVAGCLGRGPPGGPGAAAGGAARGRGRRAPADAVGRWMFGGLFGVAGLALAVLTPTVDDGSALTTAIFSALTLIVALTLLAPAGHPAGAAVADRRRCAGRRPARWCGRAPARPYGGPRRPPLRCC